MATLTVLKDTFFKESTEQAAKLTASQKASVLQGASFDLTTAELDRGHYRVDLVTPIQPVGKSGYFFAGHVQIDGIQDLPVPGKIVKPIQDGRDWYASIDSGEEFFVGTRVFYKDEDEDEGSFGLQNERADGGKYQPADYRGKYGFWADFIYPTAVCESSGGSFTCLNTYDRARFTFGFLQYAAHEPNGDFVQFFCRLLQTSLGKGYFSNLQVKDGNIFKETRNGIVSLTQDDTTEPLLNYLNPSLDDVDDIEVIQSAKFIHWAINSIQHRDIQVDTGIDLFKSAMQNYARWYPLDGVPAKICLVIADIHHQGRATTRGVMNALDTDGDYSSAFSNLIQLGEQPYPERVDTLATEIEKLEVSGILGDKTFSTRLNNFI